MGEYEPTDSRDVTGANNQARQQGHGQDAGMRSQAQAQGGAGGQMGSGQMGGDQMSGGQMGRTGEEAQALQFEADPQESAEADRRAMPAGSPDGAGPDAAAAHARAAGREGTADRDGAAGEDGLSSSAMGGAHSALAGQIREHMAVIGADGVPVGTVDHVDGDRIKLTRRDAGAGYEGGAHSGHHHYLSLGLVAAIEGDTVRLSANGDVAYGMEEEASGDAA